jgi:hypothetical protein
MFYKYIESLDTWSVSNEVHFPDGTILNYENRTEKDDFIWYDEPPKDYNDWVLTRLEDFQA